MRLCHGLDSLCFETRRPCTNGPITYTILKYIDKCLKDKIRHPYQHLSSISDFRSNMFLSISHQICVAIDFSPRFVGTEGPSPLDVAQDALGEAMGQKTQGFGRNRYSHLTQKCWCLLLKTMEPFGGMLNMEKKTNIPIRQS